MQAIIGFNFFGTEVFKSPTSGISSFYYLELKNMRIDEIHVRDKTNFEIQETKVIEDDLSQGVITQ